MKMKTKIFSLLIIAGIFTLGFILLLGKTSEKGRSVSYQLEVPSSQLKVNLVAAKNGAQVAVQKGQTKVSFETPLEGASLKKEKDEYVYKDKKGAIEIRYKPIPKGVKEEIILHQPIQTNTFDIKMTLSNAVIGKNLDGQPVIFDKNGNYQFHFEKPFAQDKKGEKTYALSYSFSETDNPDNYFLTLEIDKSWLSDPKRVYPITIDPTIIDDEKEAKTGVISQDVSIIPTQYYDPVSSTFKEINETIVPSDDPLYNYMVKEGVHQVYFKTNPSTAQTIKFYYDSLRASPNLEEKSPQKTGYSTFQPMSVNFRNDLDQLQQVSTVQAVTGAATANTFSYSNVFGTGLSLSYDYTSLMLKEELTINDFSNLPKPEQYILDGKNATLDLDEMIDWTDNLDIYIDGELWDEKTTVFSTTDRVEFRDGETVLFFIPPAYAWDSAESRNEILLTQQFKKQGTKLYVVRKVPYSWLSNPQRVYPIVIDPTISTSSYWLALAYSFQRKTWHDGTRFWAAFLTTSPEIRYEFWYSTDGTTWTENTSARLLFSGSGSDFSIEADSNNAFIVYIVYTPVVAGVRKASSYPGTSFSWGSEYASGCNHNKGAISKDTGNKLWVTCSYMSSPSFLPGTKITMANGKLKNVEDVKVDDLVYGFNPNTLELTINKVLETTHHTDSYFILETASSEVRVTGSHSFFIGNGEYKKVSELEIGDTLYIYNSQWQKISQETISKKEEIKEQVTVYDLSTDNFRNFIANNFLVHNWGSWFYAVQSTNANDVSSWQARTTLDSSAYVGDSQQGTIVPLTSGNMYAVWIDNTAIEGKKYTSGTGWDTSVTSIATGPTFSVTKNVSAVSDSSGNIHLVYIDSNNYVQYKEYTTSWQTAVQLDGTATNEYPTISINTSNGDLYAFWIRSNTIYYKKGVPPYGPDNWDSNATTFYSGAGTYPYITAAYNGYVSGISNSFAIWLNGSASPFSVMFDKIAPLPTNDSLTFTNPYGGSGNKAVADNTTEWNFRAVVSHPSGYTNLNTVVLRLANSSDNTSPYDSLKFTWTESSDTFSETADTQNAATITSTGSDSSCATNTCTLDFKIKFNTNFSAKSTNYNAELYTTDDAAATDEDTYTNFYQVIPVPAMRFEGVKMEGVKIE